MWVFTHNIIFSYLQLEVTIQKINRNQLVNIIRYIKGTTFASLTYRVDESKSKTVMKKKLLQKEVTVNISLNAIYSKKVNKILETKQDEKLDFQAQKMKGKEYSFEGCKSIVENANGNRMLYCFIENKAKRLTTYFHNDCVITKEKAIKLNLFTPAFFKVKPATTGRGLVDIENDFSVITPAISNIKRIKINKD